MAASILIVDEDSSLVSEVVALVSHDGGVSHTASTFRDAVRLLASARPDVLVTSLRLGAYNGLHLMLRGRAELPRLATIVIGPKDPTVDHEARALGASAYLPRPLTPPTIAAEIQNLCFLAPDDDDVAAPGVSLLEASVG